jgi:DNA-binding transcriptional LysR family regulator
MNSRQPECFITLAEQKSFSQTSKLLYLSQSVVSYQVKKLEEELGFRLLIRDTHNVVLTLAGENFYREMIRCRELYKKAVSDSYILDRSEQKIFKVAWHIFEIPSLLGALISTFHEKYPEMQLDLKLQTGSDYLENLISRRMDLIILYEEDLHPDPRVTFVPFWTINNYLVINSANPLARKEHLEVEDLEGQAILVPTFTPETRTANEVYTAILKRYPDADVRMLADFQFMSIPHVIANNGLALYPLPQNFPEVGVVSRPFAHCVPMVAGIAYRAEDHSQNITIAMNLMKQFFDNSVKA